MLWYKLKVQFERMGQQTPNKKEEEEEEEDGTT